MVIQKHIIKCYLFLRLYLFIVWNKNKFSMEQYAVFVNHSSGKVRLALSFRCSQLWRKWNVHVRWVSMTSTPMSLLGHSYTLMRIYLTDRLYMSAPSSSIRPTWKYSEYFGISIMLYLIFFSVIHVIEWKHIINIKDHIS